MQCFKTKLNNNKNEIVKMTPGRRSSTPTDAYEIMTAHWLLSSAIRSSNENSD